MSPTDTDRRRSPRIAAAVPVQAEWERDAKPVRVRGETEMISAYGALVRIDTAEELPTQLLLKNPRTKKKSPATVLYTVNPETDGALRVAIALDMPGEDFWGPAFSPQS